MGERGVLENWSGGVLESQYSITPPLRSGFNSVRAPANHPTRIRGSKACLLASPAYNRLVNVNVPEPANKRLEPAPNKRSRNWACNNTPGMFCWF